MSDYDIGQNFIAIGRLNESVRELSQVHGNLVTATDRDRKAQDLTHELASVNRKTIGTLQVKVENNYGHLNGRVIELERARREQAASMDKWSYDLIARRQGDRIDKLERAIEGINERAAYDYQETLKIKKGLAVRDERIAALTQRIIKLEERANGATEANQKVRYRCKELERDVDTLQARDRVTGQRVANLVKQVAEDKDIWAKPSKDYTKFGSNTSATNGTPWSGPLNWRDIVLHDEVTKFIPSEMKPGDRMFISTPTGPNPLFKLFNELVAKSKKQAERNRWPTSMFARAE